MTATVSIDIRRLAGQRVDDSNRTDILDAVATGDGRIHQCPICTHAYFTVRNAPTCYLCYYDGEIKSYVDVYADVFAALADAGFQAHLAQTGGMCMAIQIAHPGGGRFFWLTDQEDSLSFDRDPDDGWALGLYLDDDWEPEGELWYSDIKSADTALALLRAAIEEQ